MRRESFGTGQVSPSGGRGAAGRSADALERAERDLGHAVTAVEAVRAAEVALLDAVAGVYEHTAAHLEQRREEGEPGVWEVADAPAIVADEVTAATGELPTQVRSVVDLAASDPQRMACGRAALVEGRASLSRVLSWHTGTRHLQVADAVAIGEVVLTRAADGSPRSAASFRELLRRRVRKVEAADRQAARARMAEALAGRGSWTRPGEEGTGALTVVGEATRVAAAWGRLDAAARRAKAAGDQRTLAQLRSDLHLDLLLVGHLPGTCPGTASTSASAGSDHATPGSRTDAGPAGSGFCTQPILPTQTTQNPTGAEAPAPPVCTACGTVSSDWWPLPQIGDPVLPPARCTVVVGLDVLLENATDADRDPPDSGSGTSDPPPDGSAGTGPPAHTPSDTPSDALAEQAPARGGGDDLRGGGGGLRGAALGWMPGFGYLGPEHVRAVATREGSVWQRLVADPVTGHAVAVSPHTYRPTASVARFVRARDGVARDPGSGTPADQCELDHVVPFEAGGATTPDNLQCLSRRGHARKTRRHWEAVMAPDGSVEWTSLLGQRQTTHPHDYTDQ
ncbi:HNH endonuclease signature motif containing protein [Kytococcus sedentarius]|uniref:HNH endonuclease n=1 Tax=Kytococcus sedentarius (strain ATCC 14392 / DSM 20547 / JCM 11482 / CCUG 33030 / NBRC 15357 / NCTC 11040 / CCM 314 / 541) TaxID=478801 RepID=C7NIH2_KYTSD|nr:HNH endonuclease signature motif containing protein [Kytococcus sedentarius]ACV05143.1 HNH endonuclease [Kytococcus sedentarius DSM 20547]STX13453.1 HNH endonuclease [Kytococcus sedentarius]